MYRALKPDGLFVFDANMPRYLTGFTEKKSCKINPRGGFWSSSRQSLLEEAAPAGLTLEAFYSDMTGKPFAEESETICAVLRKG